MSQFVETPTKTFEASAALAVNLRVRLDGSQQLALCSASSADCIGTLTRAALVADTPVAVRLMTAQGTMPMVASGAISAGAAVYAATGGKVSSSGTIFVGEAMDAATGDGSTIEVLALRQQTGQVSLQSFPITISELRIWDSPAAVLTDTANNDDFGVSDNTFLTANPTVDGRDSKAASLTAKARFQFVVPQWYIPGETITLRVNTGMKTTIADDTATLDAQCARVAAPSVDIVATAAQSINNLTAADKDFTITPTDVVVGDILDVVLTIAVVDASTGTAVIGQINTITLLLDIKE